MDQVDVATNTLPFRKVGVAHSIVSTENGDEAHFGPVAT